MSLRVTHVVLWAVVLLADVRAAAPPQPANTHNERGPAADAVPGGPGGPGGKPLRILSIMTVDTMSHHLWMAPLTAALAKRGHHVVALDVAMPKEVPPGLNLTVIETAFTPMDQSWLRAFQGSGPIEQMIVFHKYGLDECVRDLSAPAYRRILDNSYKDTFDLIVIDYLHDCQLGVAHRFGFPGFIILSPFPGAPWVDEAMGSPPMPAVAYNTFLPYALPMSLWQRAATAALSMYRKLVEWYYRGEVNALLQRVYGEGVPDVTELRKHIHLAFVNVMPFLDQPRPYLPSVVPVGGMHVQPANMNNIPSDLAAWINNDGKGFVYVSFGSIIKVTRLKRSTVRAFIESFKELRDVRILWKIEPEIVETENLPPNVRIEKWLPQNDILGHPKLRLFVSHCGGLSTHEGTLKGVPMLAVPLNTDQFTNADKVVRNGMARLLPFDEITKVRFVAEVTEMMQNPTYRESAMRTSAMLQDKQSSPLETAVWWCEYVGRHRGAPHLRAPDLEVPWVQAMLLDVMAVLVLVAVGLGATLLCLVRKCRRRTSQ